MHAARGDCILFLDGDTELDAGFVRLACTTLQAHADVCAVWGHRRESDPQQSWFTRVLDLDWVYPAGPSLYFGGDVLIRREALLASGALIRSSRPAKNRNCVPGCARPAGRSCMLMPR